MKKSYSDNANANINIFNYMHGILWYIANELYIYHCSCVVACLNYVLKNYQPTHREATVTYDGCRGYFDSWRVFLLGHWPENRTFTQ